MSTQEKRKQQIQMTTVGAVLTALVVILQLLSNYTGAVLQTPITLVLIPIVIGAALYGAKMSTWLGFVFGLTVLLSGAANLFLSFSAIGTVVTVMVKCTACGLVTGLVYGLVNKINSKLAIWVAAVVCPVVNTGIFILGCYVFFLNDLVKYNADNGLGFGSATALIFIGFAGVNFLIELGTNVILNPTINLILKEIRKTTNNRK